jgi:hypothetical protein
MLSLRRLVVVGLVSHMWVLCANPQTRAESKKEDNLYSIALAASLDEMQRQWGRQNNGIDYDRMVVSKNPEITDDLPTQTGSHHVEVLDQQALVVRCKRAGKQLPVLEIHPMHNDGARLRIQVSLSWAQNYKRGLAIRISDWSDVYFQFDCEKGIYTISEVKLGGI